MNSVLSTRTPSTKTHLSTRVGDLVARLLAASPYMRDATAQTAHRQWACATLRRISRSKAEFVTARNLYVAGVGSPRA